MNTEIESPTYDELHSPPWALTGLKDQMPEGTENPPTRFALPALRRQAIAYQTTEPETVIFAMASSAIVPRGTRA